MTTSEWTRSPFAGVVASVLAVATVTAAVGLFKSFVPVLSLGALYVFAVLVVAVGWGIAYAVPTAVASMLAFNWFHLPPVYTFSLDDGSNWFALAGFLAVAIVVSSLAASSRRRAAEAEQREREAAVLAGASTALLRGTRLDEELERVGDDAARVLGVSAGRIDLGPRVRPPASGESPLPLEFDSRVIGTLYIPSQELPEVGALHRFLPALASLLGVAAERERLAREALEAEALRRSDTIKTAVIRAVSHDLRTPLATIEAALGGLQGTVALDEEDRAALLDTIAVELSRLKRLVENLLDLSRLQAGAATPNPELWTADELLAGALEEVAGSERVTLTIPDDLPPARVDALQVQRVLANLLENALKFSPPNEPVHVRVTATRSELVFRVVDRGPGVPEHELERIFEPFHRAAGSRDRRGAGLGLAIALGFAQANGGRLWAESHTGQGASFALALPSVEIPAGVRA
jgi:two-component system sensor histidine kinase KdpD